MSRHTLLSLLTLSSLLVVPPPALAADPPDGDAAASQEIAFPQDPPITAVPKREARWRLSAMLGGLAGNEHKGIEDALRDAGFDDYLSGSCFIFCSSGTAYPHSNRGGRPWMLELGYDLKPKLAVTLVAANTALGYTYGYRDEAGHVTIGRELRTWGAVASWLPSSRVRIGAGPALNTIRIEAVNGASPKHRVGLLLDGSVDVVKSSMLLVSVRAQYRFTGSVPVSLRSGGDYTYGPSGYEWNSGTDVGPIDIPFNHLFLGFGIGVRF